MQHLLVAASPGSVAAPPRGGPVRWTSSRRYLEVLIEQECDATGRQHEPAHSRTNNNQRHNLVQRLHRLGLDMITMTGDGNCQVGFISSLWRICVFFTLIYQLSFELFPASYSATKAIIMKYVHKLFSTSEIILMTSDHF